MSLPTSLSEFIGHFKKNRKNLLFSLVTIIVFSGLFVGLIEVYSLIKLDDEWVCEICIFDSEMGWKHKPNASVHSVDRTYSTNSLGFRGEEPSLNKKHILILGDSVGFGVGVSDDQSLDAHFNSQLSDFQALNLSVSGYGIGQYYLQLKNHINLIKPRHVWIIIYTGNDIDDTRKDTMFGVSKPLLVVEDGFLKNINPSIQRFSCANWTKMSKFLINFIPPKAWSRLCKSKVLTRKDAAKQIERIFKEIANLSLSKGADFLFVLSPSYDSILLGACRSGRTSENCDSVDPGFLEFYNYFKIILEQNSLNYLDFQNLILHEWQNIELKKLYNDPHHYSSSGNKLLADSLIKYLATLNEK
tara:strand:- start:353 stop:1426 length:1074 start_codon:yes stop_codon:yes gene_type:complete